MNIVDKVQSELKKNNRFRCIKYQNDLIIFTSIDIKEQYDNTNNPFSVVSIKKTKSIPTFFLFTVDINSELAQIFLDAQFHVLNFNKSTIVKKDILKLIEDFVSTK